LNQKRLGAPLHQAFFFLATAKHKHCAIFAATHLLFIADDSPLVSMMANDLHAQSFALSHAADRKTSLSLARTLF
jgi:ActR/RegA family two-component response regulator